MKWWGPALLLLALAPAVPAIAQADEAALPTATDLDRIAATVPDQSWYPEGYYDIRIAAEAEAAESPRPLKVVVGACPDGDGQCTDLSNPIADRIVGDEGDRTLARYGNIALEVSRFRQDLMLAGYPATVYASPLAAYECRLVAAAANDDKPPSGFEEAAAKQLAAAIETERQRLAPALPRVIAGDATLTEQSVVIRSSGASANKYPPGAKIRHGDTLVLRAGDRVMLLGGGGTRTLVGPGTFTVPDAGTARVSGAMIGGLLTSRAIRHTRIGAVRSNGVAGNGVVVVTLPPGGEVLLVNAFAFKVCTRKTQDPWDRFACKWNEIETGVEKPLSGRYVYQVRWPDGAVRKGTREIMASPEGASGGTVTLKKTGS